MYCVLSLNILQTTAPDQFERLMRVNYLGSVHCTKCVVPGMIQRRKGMCNMKRFIIQFKRCIAKHFSMHGMWKCGSHTRIWIMQLHYASYVILRFYIYALCLKLLMRWKLKVTGIRADCLRSEAGSTKVAGPRTFETPSCLHPRRIPKI